MGGRAKLGAGLEFYCGNRGRGRTKYRVRIKIFSDLQLFLKIVCDASFGLQILVLAYKFRYWPTNYFFLIPLYDICC